MARADVKALEVTRETRWHCFDSPQAVAEEAARRILEAAGRALARRGRFRVVLAGGRSPEQAYRLLRKAETDWSGWQIYFGDERCLPAGHAERNSTMAWEAWLDHVPIPGDQVHAIPAELGAESAAASYEPLVEEALPFDLVLLGLGEDGHTASLFPGHDHPDEGLVHAVQGAPKPPPDRVSLSARALGNGRRVLFLVTGEGKRQAVTAWRGGERVPAALVMGLDGVDVLLDRAAGAGA